MSTENVALVSIVQKKLYSWYEKIGIIMFITKIYK